MKNILITDTDVPSIFFLATGRKYTKNELCINDLRRFFQMAVLYCIGKSIDKKTFMEWKR